MPFSSAVILTTARRLSSLGSIVPLSVLTAHVACTCCCCTASTSVLIAVGAAGQGEERKGADHAGAVPEGQEGHHPGLCLPPPGCGGVEEDESPAESPLLCTPQDWQGKSGSISCTATCQLHRLTACCITIMVTKTRASQA